MKRSFSPYLPFAFSLWIATIIIAIVSEPMPIFAANYYRADLSSDQWSHTDAWREVGGTRSTTAPLRHDQAVLDAVTGIALKTSHDVEIESLHVKTVITDDNKGWGIQAGREFKAGFAEIDKGALLSLTSASKNAHEVFFFHKYDNDINLPT